jgi:hypothetical protein
LTAVVAPSSVNVLAGLAGSVHTAEPGDGAVAGLKLVLTDAARDRERYPSSLAGQIELVGQRLRGTPSRTDLYLPPAVKASLLAQRDEALEAVRYRRAVAFVEAHTRAEIRAAARLIAEHKLRGVLLAPRHVGGLEDDIRRSASAVIVGPLRPQDAELTTRELASLFNSGVPLAFGGSAAEARQSAAWLTNFGLSRPTARRALAGKPAEGFGLPPETGRLAPGDAADFVVWDGDPLDPTARAVAVVVKGQRVAKGPAAEARPAVGRGPTQAAPPPRTRRR